MTYDTFRYIFYGGAGLAALNLVIAVILFFVLKIPSVIGDITGSTARKAIEDIKSHNNNMEESIKNVSKNNTTTEKITSDGKVVKITKKKKDNSPVKSNVGNKEQTHVEQVKKNNTTLLDSRKTGNTTILGSENTPMELSDVNQSFTVEYELTFIHTDVVIS